MANRASIFGSRPGDTDDLGGAFHGGLLRVPASFQFPKRIVNTLFYIGKNLDLAKSYRNDWSAEQASPQSAEARCEILKPRR